MVGNHNVDRYLGSSEGVSHSSVGGKGEDGDEHGSCGPEVDTEGIQVLPSLQTRKL